MKVVCRAEATDKGLVLHYPSQGVKERIMALYRGTVDKYNGYLTVAIDKPYKSRTTGKGSQNNLFWKLVEIIGNETGEEPKEIEQDLKVKAVSKGYPYKVSRISGRIVPASMTEVNTVEMSYLIDTAYEVCAFLGIEIDRDLKGEIKWSV